MMWMIAQRIQRNGSSCLLENTKTWRFPPDVRLSDVLGHSQQASDILRSSAVGSSGERPALRQTWDSYGEWGRMCELSSTPPTCEAGEMKIKAIKWADSSSIPISKAPGHEPSLACVWFVRACSKNRDKHNTPAQRTHREQQQALTVENAISSRQLIWTADQTARRRTTLLKTVPIPSSRLQLFPPVAALLSTPNDIMTQN